MKKFDLGTGNNTKTGDDGQAVGNKLNENFAELVKAIFGQNIWQNSDQENLNLSVLQTADKGSLIQAINWLVNNLSDGGTGGTATLTQADRDALDDIPNKLDKGSYTGNADALKSDIDGKLPKGNYAGTGEDLDTEIKNRILKPQTFTGNVIPLDECRASFQTDTAKAFTNYVLSQVVVLGSEAKIWINTTTEPTVTGAVKINSADWEIGVDFDLIVEAEQLDTNGGVRVIWYLVKR